MTSFFFWFSFSLYKTESPQRDSNAPKHRHDPLLQLAMSIQKVHIQWKESSGLTKCSKINTKSSNISRYHMSFIIILDTVCISAMHVGEGNGVGVPEQSSSVFTFVQNHMSYPHPTFISSSEQTVGSNSRPTQSWPNPHSETYSFLHWCSSPIQLDWVIPLPSL